MLYDYMNILESIGLDLLLRLSFLNRYGNKRCSQSGNVPRSVVVLFGNALLACWLYREPDSIKLEGTGLG